MILDVTCSHYGAQLALDGSTQFPVCTFCGTRNTLSVDIWQQVRPPPPPEVKIVPAPPSSPLAVPIVIVAVLALGAIAAGVALVLGRSSSPKPAPSAFAAPRSEPKEDRTRR